MNNIRSYASLKIAGNNKHYLFYFLFYLFSAGATCPLQISYYYLRLSEITKLMDLFYFLLELVSPYHENNYGVVRPFLNCTLWFDQTIISILVSVY
jgi:hypothetical protein